MGAFIKAAAQTAGNVGTSLWNNLFAKRNLRLQTEQNKELAKYSYDLNLEQWNAQNAYNTPQAQMQRFKEAGLNPNLIYGQGSSGNASASPQMSTVTAGRHTPKMPKLDTLAMYNNQRQVDAGVSNLNARTQLTELQSTTALIDQAIKRINREQGQMSLDWDKGQNLTYRDKYGLNKNNYQAKKNTEWNLLHGQRGLQNQTYQMQAKKMALVDGQIDLALIDLATKKRAYKWQNVNNIANLAGKAVGLGIGGKFAKGATKKLKAPSKPKFSKYSYNDYKQNRDIQPNRNF